MKREVSAPIYFELSYVYIQPTLKVVVLNLFYQLLGYQKFGAINYFGISSCVIALLLA